MVSGCSDDGVMFSFDAAAVPDAAVADCRLEDVFSTSALDVAAPRSEAYLIPDERRRQGILQVVSAVAAGELGTANAIAPQVGYSICRDGTAVLIRPTDQTGQARVAMELAPRTDLIVEAPHPYFDIGTLDESLGFFRSLGPRALIAAGAHRCANTAPGCSGSSTACGQPAGFRHSDAAHAVDGTFHAAHIAASALFPDAKVVSVHGYGRRGVGLSDGTKEPVGPTSFVARMAAALQTLGVSPVTSCNPGAGVPVETTLCGTTNVQGRHLNGANPACTRFAVRSSGRFLHLEQGLATRGRVDTVAQALLTALQ